MFLGSFLLFISTFFQESRNTISKGMVVNGVSKNSLAVFGNIGIFIVFGIILAYKLFNEYEIPSFFGTDFIIYQTLFTLGAIIYIAINLSIFKIADRSTQTALGSVGFIYSLIMDSIFLGAELSNVQIIGIFIIASTFFLFNIGKSKTLNLTGLPWIIILVIIGASNNLLFKHLVNDIQSPVEVSQMISIAAGVLIFLYLRKKEGRPMKLKKLNKKYLIISLFGALNIVIFSYSFLYLDASIVQTLKASLASIYGTIFGCIFFKEKNLGSKLFMLSFIILGVSMITFGDIITANILNIIK